MRARLLSEGLLKRIFRNSNSLCLVEALFRQPEKPLQACAAPYPFGFASLLPPYGLGCLHGDLLYGDKDHSTLTRRRHFLSMGRMNGARRMNGVRRMNGALCGQ